MVAAVRVHKTGGPEVLTYEDVPVPAPGPGQIKIRNHACGVNFIDTYFRMGMYPSPVGLPFVSGNEGAGEVIAVGPGVTDFAVGDRVGYTSALGAYAAERLLPADRAVKLPAQISAEREALVEVLEDRNGRVAGLLREMRKTTAEVDHLAARAVAVAEATERVSVNVRDTTRTVEGIMSRNSASAGSSAPGKPFEIEPYLEIAAEVTAAAVPNRNANT